MDFESLTFASILNIGAILEEFVAPRPWGGERVTFFCCRFPFRQMVAMHWEWWDGRADLETEEGLGLVNAVPHQSDILTYGLK